MLIWSLRFEIVFQMMLLVSNQTSIYLCHPPLPPASFVR